MSIIIFINNREFYRYTSQEMKNQDISTNDSSKLLQIATLGGGCFWCLEAVYQELRGVVRVVSGYAGGHVPNPSYEAVCTEATGHAEVVQLQFDPSLISYEELLKVFFVIHDPTTLNRQGNDVGTQYRSVIFYHDANQENCAQQLIRQLQEGGVYTAPIVTEVLTAPVFYPAEDYHQNYFKNHPYQGYCMAVVAPKLAKFRQVFSEKRKA